MDDRQWTTDTSDTTDPYWDKLCLLRQSGANKMVWKGSDLKEKLDKADNNDKANGDDDATTALTT